MTHRLLLHAALLLLLACLIGHAHAASFDCAKTTLPIEQTICRDPELNKADEALAAAWQAALAATLDQPALRDEQRQWQHNRGTTAAGLTEAYRRRTEQLNETADKWRAMPRRFAADKLNDVCFVTPEVDADLTCRVEESGKVDSDDKLSYQLQGLFDHDLRMNGGAVLFAVSADTLVPVLSAFGDTAHYERPKLVHSDIGTLLWISGHIEGTGNFNAEQLYVWRDAGWRDIDTTSWLHDLARRLPNRLYAAKGIYPDYRTMTAATPLWRPEDGNCCPQGGRATIRLGLKDRRLVLEDSRITRGRAAAERE